MLWGNTNKANTRPGRTGHSQRSAGPGQALEECRHSGVLALLDPSSLIHLPPIPAMTCFPTAPQSPFPGNPHQDFYLSGLSCTVTISPVYSGLIFLPRFFITSTPSIQFLAYFLFFSTCPPASWQDIWTLLTIYLPSGHQSSSSH